jgi:hypothetical protein
MTETTKQAQPALQAKAQEPKKIAAALDEKQLDQVAGGTGTLMTACATGKHIPKVTITT